MDWQFATKNERTTRMDGSFFMAEDNAPHYVRRSSGHLPTVGRFPSLSGFAIQLKLGKSGMGLSHPLRGFSSHAILRDNKKRTTRLDSSFFIMAEDMGLENEITKFHECSQMFTNVHFSTVLNPFFANVVSQFFTCFQVFSPKM